MTPDMPTWAPIPLRLMLGIGFVHHGFHKIVFTGQHWEFVTLLQWIGVPHPNQILWVVSVFEFIGGAAILLGAFTRVVPIPLILHMLTTLVVVHARQGFDFMQFEGMGSAGPRFGVPGYEVNLLYAAGLLALVAVGAGRPSVDAWRLARRSRGP
jgi:putative oxidoreductase